MLVAGFGSDVTGLRRRQDPATTGMKTDASRKSGETEIAADDVGWF